jgi:hypothetical protein
MRCSIGQLRDIKAGPFWQDVEDELKVWLLQVHEQLENSGLSASHRELDRLGGCCEAIRNFSDIFTVLIGLAEENTEAREEVLHNLIKGR